MNADWQTLTVDGSAMRCHLTLPETWGPFPGVVIIHHAPGVDGFVEEIAGRLGEAEYAAIAPDLYHRAPPSSSDAVTRVGTLEDANVIADATATIAYMKKHPAVRTDRIGIIGFCMGGRVAYLMATQDRTLKAAVAFYGGDVMKPWGDGTAPFELSLNIRAPLLGLFGEDDANPSPADVAKIDGELTRLGKSHEFHSYPGAGHAFMVDGRPTYRADAATDAWSRCVAWLDSHMKI